MATTFTGNAPGALSYAADEPEVLTRAEVVPWSVWCAVAAVTFAATGVFWDISWHSTIGRDTFWTPAHMLIYAAGLLSGLSGAWVIFATTFGNDRDAAERSIRVLGFRGPLGSFIGAWGAGAMLTSAPFDNWWHAAYGLDVKIQSPPHAVLACGIGAILVAALFLVASYRNNATGEPRRRLDRMLRWVGGILLVLGCIYSWENTFPQEMHSALFYNSLAFVPVTLISIALASESRWPATTVAAVYTAFWAAGLWILPLFPAQPRLGPVYQHITHMIPLGFPLLLIVPAMVIDLVRARSDNFKSWIAAPVAGCAFLATFFAVQWPFADFLLSPAARNPIFGQAYFWYGDTANFLRNPYVFVAMEKTRGEFWIVTAASFAVAIIASVIGRGWGNALRDIRR